jgi:hypothetical protein
MRQLLERLLLLLRVFPVVLFSSGLLLLQFGQLVPMPQTGHTHGHQVHVLQLSALDLRVDPRPEGCLCCGQVLLGPVQLCQLLLSQAGVVFLDLAGQLELGLVLHDLVFEVGQFFFGLDCLGLQVSALVLQVQILVVLLHEGLLAGQLCLQFLDLPEPLLVLLPLTGPLLFEPLLGDLVIELLMLPLCHHLLAGEARFLGLLPQFREFFLHGLLALPLGLELAVQLAQLGVDGRLALVEGLGVLLHYPGQVLLLRLQG